MNTYSIEYMMGYKISTYHNVRMLIIEKLRQIYARSGLSIKPKTNVSKVEMLKEFTRSLGLDPEKILIRDAFTEPHQNIITDMDKEKAQIQALGVVKERLRREVLH